MLARSQALGSPASSLLGILSVGLGVTSNLQGEEAGALPGCLATGCSNGGLLDAFEAEVA